MIHLYLRVSTNHQDLGIAAQEAKLRDWLDTRIADKVSVNFSWWTDDGVSGSIPLAERPAGMQMLAQLQPGDSVVAVKIDRLFRSMLDAVATLDDWGKKGISLISLAEGFDMTNPYGVAMFRIIAAIADLERAMIRERTKAALKIKRDRCGSSGGNTYYGKTWFNGDLIDNPSEREVIALMVKYARAGFGTMRIADLLNNRGLLKRNGGKWNHNMVRKILVGALPTWKKGRRMGAGSRKRATDADAFTVDYAGRQPNQVPG